MADKTVTVNHGHRVYLDPEHGLQLPRAEDLAEHGIVTDSAVVVNAGETVKAAGDTSQNLRDAGIAR